MTDNIFAYRGNLLLYSSWCKYFRLLQINYSYYKLIKDIIHIDQCHIQLPQLDFEMWVGIKSGVKTTGFHFAFKICLQKYKKGHNCW